MICGAILNRPKKIIDPRVLILFGVMIFMLSMWQLGHLTTQSGEPDTRTALMIRGFGLGFLFTPINNAVYANLKRNEVQQASGLINLARQLGGSFGIAILGTFVINHTQYHRVDLLRNLYPGNPVMQQRLQGTTGALMAHGLSHVQAQRVAVGVLNQTIMRQAATMSYNDAFLMILIVFCFTAPAILLLRKSQSSAPAGAVDAH
jgi:DHA2 family multidrug resistance protein